MANPYGDVELDAQGMRALAHPVRVAIMARLQQYGPSTATALSAEVGASPSVTSWHLRHLAKHGLVRDAERQGNGRERWWEAASRGYRFRSQDTESRQAGRLLQQVIQKVEGDLVQRWERDTAPHLEPHWLDLAGRASTRVLVTPDELRDLESAIESLIAPYVVRKDTPDDVPDGARGVRLLHHTLPEASPGD
jgi:DNA-binding transcriptional ArsR family regulator